MLRFKRRDGKVDQRRRHRHFRVTVIYKDRGQFGRVYNDIQKAEKFAARQERSPVVETAHVNRIR
jgi:hypothetical protein